MEKTLPLLFMGKVAERPESIMQYSKQGGDTFQPTSYRQMQEEIATLAAGFLELGVQRGDRIGLISDNRKEWLISDLAILGLGAADVPRGCDAVEQEIAYILSFSGCRLTVLENEKQLAKVLARKAELPELSIAIMYDSVADSVREQAAQKGITVLMYADLFETGRKRRLAKPGEYEEE
ncbi:MAG TPA: AMP-binding protein, partial [Spirochaetales bacterium]|nr:AMP-binding protein [Spirochaetales bacterium]